MSRCGIHPSHELTSLGCYACILSIQRDYYSSLEESIKFQSYPDHIAILQEKLAECIDALKFYANPGKYTYDEKEELISSAYGDNRIGIRAQNALKKVGVDE